MDYYETFQSFIHKETEKIAQDMQEASKKTLDIQPLNEIILCTMMIDGIKCNVSIQVWFNVEYIDTLYSVKIKKIDPTKTDYYAIIIRVCDIFSNNYDIDRSLKIQSQLNSSYRKIKSIEELWKYVTTLKEMRFNKLTAQFELPEEYEEKMKESQMLAMIEGYTTECCVCLSLTRSFTVCNHPLCLQCWSGIIQKNGKSCPLCRKICLSRYDYTTFHNRIRYNPYTPADHDDESKDDE